MFNDFVRQNYEIATLVRSSALVTFRGSSLRWRGLGIERSNTQSCSKGKPAYQSPFLNTLGDGISEWRNRNKARFVCPL
jgi:hypothetical protein